MSEEKRGRGRPPAEFTEQRAETVWYALHVNGPMRRQDLAEMLGVNKNLVYLSLVRLRDAGRVGKQRNGKYHEWAVTAKS